MTQRISQSDMYSDLNDIDQRLNRGELSIRDLWAAIDGGGGGGSDSNFVYEQTTPSDTWVVEHDLDKQPSVDVLNDDDQLILADVTYDSDSQVTITFGRNYTGKAVLN